MDIITAFSVHLEIPDLLYSTWIVEQCICIPISAIVRDKKAQRPVYWCSVVGFNIPRVWRTEEQRRVRVLVNLTKPFVCVSPTTLRLHQRYIEIARVVLNMTLLHTTLRVCVQHTDLALAGGLWLCSVLSRPQFSVNVIDGTTTHHTTRVRTTHGLGSGRWSVAVFSAE
ncbi:hypothetical protein J6590_067255 [Homalodisca vitripennis]|nr:hypothetical protein J6590_067255 [Homalodisca vitripennis]